MSPAPRGNHLSCRPVSQDRLLFDVVFCHEIYMYYSLWKNFALYRKFGKIRKYNSGSFATPHPFPPFISILGCFACLTLFILLPRYRYRFNSLSFLEFFFKFLIFWDGGWVSKNSEAEQRFGGLFIASFLYTDLTRGFFSRLFRRFFTPQVYYDDFLALVTFFF
jgi:hypothetical protein